MVIKVGTPGAFVRIAAFSRERRRSPGMSSRVEGIPTERF